MKSMKYLFATSTIFLILLSGFTIKDKPVKQAKELGEVNWLRDYDLALEKSNAEGKPVFILFQEVPGCITCKNYGDNVLSNGFLVDAIETEFIPLAIYNNKGGADKKVLDKYGEPTWNNPVVRIVNEKGDNIVGRLSGDYSVNGLANTMADALFKEGKSIPAYLNLLIDANKPKLETAFYKMYCFWSGEGHLGNKEGVVATEPGFMNGAEVVKVEYNSLVISKDELDEYAAEAKCQPTNQAIFSIDKDPQYYLKKSNYRYLPLSAIQKTKINSALLKNEDPNQYLSPSQLNWFYLIKQKKDKEQLPVLYTQDFSESWWNMEVLLCGL